jgi:hypothetical protein
MNEVINLAPTAAAPAVAMGPGVTQPAPVQQAVPHPGVQQGPVLVPVPIDDIFRISNEYEQAGRLDEAESLLKRILQVAPKQPDSTHLLGIVAFRKGRMAEAAELVEQAIANGVNTPLYFRNICTIYERLGRLEESVAAGKRAVELDPGDPHALHNLTVVYYRLLDLDASIDCADRAIALDPTIAGPHFAKAEALLLRGEMEQGWKEYEWRYQIPGAAQLMPKTDKPQWDGKPIENGILMLIADQGFGDVIQFGRYMEWAAERCPNIHLACAKELHAVARQMLPSAKIFDKWEDKPDFAAYCPLSGLPRLHGTRVDNIPSKPLYVTPDPAKTAQWASRLKTLIPARYSRIGIAWAGRPTHNNDVNRSAALSVFSPIAAVPGVALVSLQKGERQGETGKYFGRAPLYNLSAEIEDFEDTAAIMANLDLIVTVDTSVAHLGAAMGKPVWIMLPYAPDWRWLLNRTDTPWYPTVRLFRQSKPRVWDDVMGAIVAAIPEQFATAGASAAA